MADSALPQRVAAKEPLKGSLIELAVVVVLGACAGAAFEALRPAPVRIGKGRGSHGGRVAGATFGHRRPAADRDQSRRAPGHLDSARRLDHFRPPRLCPIPKPWRARIGDDILAYLRTVSLRQLEGPIGLENIRQDLNDRAAIRSDGKVREFVIRTLVVQ